jgi:glycosyltransferase involved in cell wall biosynthesis
MRIVITRREALDVPDGINIFIFSLAEALLQQGHEVLAVSNVPSDLGTVERMFGLRRYPEIVALSHRSAGRHVDAGRTWLLRGRRVVRALEPDAILINGGLPVKFGTWSCAISHDLEAVGRGVRLLRRLYKFYAYRNVDEIVTTTSEIRSALSQEIRVPLGNIRCIPTCVCLDLYPNLPHAQRERAVLHMGTVFYKNPQATIRAFNHLADNGTRLYVTGNPAQIPPDVMAGLDSRVREQISFVGHLSAADLRALIGRVTLVSVPSDYAVPVASPTVIESLAAGTPVVGSFGISKDVLVDDRNGFQCHTDDVFSIAQRYDALLNDGDLWQRLNGGCRDTVQQFSAATVANSYLKLIETALPASARSR